MILSIKDLIRYADQLTNIKELVWIPNVVDWQIYRKIDVIVDWKNLI